MESTFACSVVLLTHCPTPRSVVKPLMIPHKRRIEDHFSSNNIRQVWQGVQHITNYRSSNLTAADGDDSLAEGLNCFFTRFEVDTPDVTTPLPLDPCSHTLTVQAQEVRCVLRE